MPQSNWNFLDQELLTWWMTEENFHQVIDHFLVMRICLEPQSLPTGCNGWHRGTEGASQYVNGRNGGIKRELSP